MIWTPFDTWIVITAALSAMACAVLGNYLVLRKLSMMGDAISHTVLPGLAIAFLITGTRDSVPMFIGAAVIGIVTALLVQGLSKYSRMDEGSAMGVVFTTLFAVGLVLITNAAEHVDLDPGCVLYGAIELAPLDTRRLFGLDVPIAAITNGLMLIVNLAFVGFFHKELKVCAFDPEMAESLGISAGRMHYVLMTLVAATCVSAFESVGSILVIAMLIVPGAAAWLLVGRMSSMILVSLIFAAASAFLGHLSAITVPGWFGHPSTSTAGMMGGVSGLLFAATFFLSPRHGILSRAMHHGLLSLRVAREDILATLYRREEREEGAGAATLGWRNRLAERILLAKGEISGPRGNMQLTESGRDSAKSLVSAHRLWETYLVTEGGSPTERVHGAAERLEHFTDEEMRGRLAAEAGHPDVDPHNRSIPK